MAERTCSHTDYLTPYHAFVCVRAVLMAVHFHCVPAAAIMSAVGVPSGPL